MFLEYGKGRRVHKLKRRLQAAVFTVAPGAQPGLCHHQGSCRSTIRGSLKLKLGALISKKTYRCVVALGVGEGRVML